MYTGIILVQFLVMVPFIVGWIISLVALWRAMKAHESIAAIIEELANESQRKSE
jgi:hypothetical protein